MKQDNLLNLPQPYRFFYRSCFNNDLTNKKRERVLFAYAHHLIQYSQRWKWFLLRCKTRMKYGDKFVQ